MVYKTRRLDRVAKLVPYIVIIIITTKEGTTKGDKAQSLDQRRVERRGFPRGVACREAWLAKRRGWMRGVACLLAVGQFVAKSNIGFFFPVKTRFLCLVLVVFELAL